jgi:hypothetical protein
VRSHGLIPASASCQRQVPGTGAAGRLDRMLGQHGGDDDLAAGHHQLPAGTSPVPL